MAQLGKLIWTVLDSNGSPVSGASVAVRKQGATVNGAHAGSNTSFTVNDPGGITTSSENVVVNIGTTTRSVSSVGATNVTVGAPGFDDVADDDRLSPTTNTPTLYNDATGTESTGSSTLTTNSNGLATAWLRGGSYDIRVSAASITTALYTDVPIVAEDTASNVFTSGSQDAFILDTNRALASGDALLSVRENGTQRVWVAQDGKLTIVAGGLVVAGGAAITGNSTVVGTLGGVTVATIEALTLSGGTGFITGITDSTSSGDTKVNRIKARQGTKLVTGDFSIHANWGGGAALTFAQDSYDAQGAFQVTAGTTPAADPTVVLTYSDGSWTTSPTTVAVRADANAPKDATWSVTSQSNTGATFTFIGTPVDGTAYACRFIVLG